MSNFMATARDAQRIESFLSAIAGWDFEVDAGLHDGDGWEARILVEDETDADMAWHFLEADMEGSDEGVILTAMGPDAVSAIVFAVLLQGCRVLESIALSAEPEVVDGLASAALIHPRRHGLLRRRWELVAECWPVAEGDPQAGFWMKVSSGRLRSKPNAVINCHLSEATTGPLLLTMNSDGEVIKASTPDDVRRDPYEA